MYKKQMTLQRIVSYVLLVAAALVFLYSLGLVTDLYESKFAYYAENYEEPKIEGTQIYYDMQGFNQELTKAGIVLILLAAAGLLFQNHTRRRYYIANYITIGVNFIAGIAVSAWASSSILTYKEQFLKIDFNAIAEYAEMYQFKYTDSTFWFDISIPICAILVITNVLCLINMIWKIGLMRAEKKLIAEGREV